jgi:four helix bundle protein
MNSFEELDAWILSRDLRLELSQLVKSFPKIEQYRLTDQIIRASRSVTANIAEGFGRFHFQENIQFCRHARGSLWEIIDHLTVAAEENYISIEISEEFRNKIFRVIKVLNGYIAYLKKAKDNSAIT